MKVVVSILRPTPIIVGHVIKPVHKVHFVRQGRVKTHVLRALQRLAMVGASTSKVTHITAENAAQHVVRINSVSMAKLSAPKIAKNVEIAASTPTSTPNIVESVEKFAKQVNYVQQVLV